MRYGETHKQETHARLLNLAAKALREKGPDDLAIAEVMKAAGLTHGGFYAHFKSKDAFLAETLTATFAQSDARMRRMVEGLPPRQALATYIDQYVSALHRDDPAAGCPIAALSSDLPRQSRKFKAAFDAGVNAAIGRLEGWMAEAGVPDAKGLAPLTLSAMTGAVTLSRAISDRKLSDEILQAARTGIKARLGLGVAVPMKMQMKK
jgi:TetR/AcrR family transcriptional repressor of nem operon